MSTLVATSSKAHKLPLHPINGTCGGTCLDVQSGMATAWQFGKTLPLLGMESSTNAYPQNTPNIPCTHKLISEGWARKGTWSVIFALFFLRRGIYYPITQRLLGSTGIQTTWHISTRLKSFSQYEVAWKRWRPVGELRTVLWRNFLLESQTQVDFQTAVFLSFPGPSLPPSLKLNSNEWAGVVWRVLVL